MAHPLGLDWLDRWKAKHEAAHAVLAIFHGGTVSYIDIDFHGDRQGVSWRLTPQASLADYCAVIGAGAAIDRRLAPSHQQEIASEPNFLKTASSQDSKTAPVLMAQLNQPSVSTAQFDELFETGVAAADAAMDNEQVMQAITALSDSIYDTFLHGQMRLGGQAVHSIVVPVLAGADS